MIAGFHASLNCGTRIQRWSARVVRGAAFVALTALVAACSDETMGPPPASPGGTGSSTATANPLAGVAFYFQANNHARRQATAWASSRPADAQQMEKIATRPQANWFGSWSGDVRASVSAVMSAAAQQSAVPVLVSYHIPRLDCGTGGASPDGYRNWISSFASGIASGRAIVILEPDAVAAMSCLSGDAQNVRAELLRYAISQFKALPGVTLYVDAGHPRWHSAAEIVRRLFNVGVEHADGFALNVSNFVGTADNLAYGADVSARLGGKHFVVDTGRNGRGPTADLQWCNPDGRGLGNAPGTNTGVAGADAFLWIKPPGESDGACNGGPTGGAWWPEYALGLAQRS